MRVNTRGMDPTNLGGFQVPKPGKYHAIVSGVQCGSEMKPDLVTVEFGILCGTTPGQERLTWKEYFSVDSKPGASRAALLATVLEIVDPGLIGQEDDIDIDFEAANGRSLIVDGQHETYKGKNGEDQTSFKAKPKGFLSLRDPKGFDCPVDPQQCRLWGVDPASRVAGGSGAKPTAAKPAAAAPQQQAATPQPPKPAGWDQV